MRAKKRRHGALHAMPYAICRLLLLLQRAAMPPCCYAIRCCHAAACFAAAMLITRCLRAAITPFRRLHAAVSPPDSMIMPRATRRARMLLLDACVY